MFVYNSATLLGSSKLQVLLGTHLLSLTRFCPCYYLTQLGGYSWFCCCGYSSSWRGILTVTVVGLLVILVLGHRYLVYYYMTNI